MQNPLLIFDADPVVYRAGFAAQSSTYEYVYETKAGAVKQRFFTDGNKALAFFRRYKGLEVLSKDVHITVDPVVKAYAAVKQVMTDTITGVTEKWRCDRDSIDVRVILSGPGNFREELATIAPYKGNRTTAPPVHYQAVRNFITDNYAAEVVHGWEADDECSILAREAAADGRLYCVASIDKDLDQVPGYHYNYVKHVYYNVADLEAEWFFWQQCLSGDSTDGIPGGYKVGEGKAAKLIQEWASEGISPEEFWARIVAEYSEVLEKYPDKYPEGMTAQAAALETARLVKMMDYRGQLWTPPGEDDEQLPGR